MADSRVDPETGATRAHPLPWSTLGSAVGGLLFAALVLWAVWSWTPFNLRVDVGELETRVDRLERLHIVDHKRELLREELQRRLELEATRGPEVPL